MFDSVRRSGGNKASTFSSSPQHNMVQEYIIFQFQRRRLYECKKAPSKLQSDFGHAVPRALGSLYPLVHFRFILSGWLQIMNKA